MRKVIVFSALLCLGLLGAQWLPGLAGPRLGDLVHLLTMTTLGFIMIHVGLAFDIDQKNARAYGRDFVIAMSAASLPWLLVTGYFLWVMLPTVNAHALRPPWQDALLLGLFSAPTSAGILFAMLAAAGLGGTWMFRKARVLAIFDDVGVLLLLIPLQVIILGPAWQLGVAVSLMLALLWLAWSFLHRLPLPTAWPWVLGYGAFLALANEALYVSSKTIDEALPINLGVLLPAFVLGCLMRRPRSLSPVAANEEIAGGSHTSDTKAATIVAGAFMLLVGLSMPAIGIFSSGPSAGNAASTGGVASAMIGGAALLWHVLILTVLCNIGKMVPALCYRREATWRERLSLAIAMWPRGEVGAGVLVLSLAYGASPDAVTAAVLSLMLNLVLTGGFIVIIKRIHPRLTNEALAGAAGWRRNTPMAITLRKLDPHEMGTGRIAHTLLTLAIPAAIAGVLATTYELTDGIFISWLGKDQLAGLGMGAPVLFLAYAIGLGVGIGVTALVSRLLGQQRHDDAQHVLNQALLISFITGSILSIAGPLLAEPALRLMGANGDVLIFGSQFLSRVMLGAVLMHVGLVADAGLRAQGNTLTGMRIGILGNLANLILDGLFIFGPHNPAAHLPNLWGLRQLADFYVAHGFDMGVQGGATATVLTRLLVVCLLLAALCSRRSTVRATPPWHIRPHRFWQTAGRLYRLGLPATISMSGMAISTALVNYLLTHYDQTAVGVLTAANRIEFFGFVPIFSLGGAVVPMMGYNLGAHHYARCRRIVLVACAVAGSVMAVFGALLFIFPRPILMLFTDAPDVLDMGVTYLRINSWSYFIIGCDIMLSNAFLGLGRAELSMLTQLTRTLIVKVPAAWLLGLAYGVSGIWFSFPASTLASFLAATAIMIWLLRRLPAQHPAAPPTGPAEVPPEIP